jgi:hypothetical protein
VEQEVKPEPFRTIQLADAQAHIVIGRRFPLIEEFNFLEGLRVP